MLHFDTSFRLFVFFVRFDILCRCLLVVVYSLPENALLVLFPFFLAHASDGMISRCCSQAISQVDRTEHSAGVHFATRAPVGGMYFP